MPFPTYATKEEIPAGAEDVYAEQDGRWVPQVPVVEDVTPLKETLGKERERLAAAEKQVKAADTARAAAERERDALKTQIGDPEAKTKALLEKFEVDIAEARREAEAELEKARGELRTVRLDDKAKAAFLKAGGRPEKADAALTLAKHRFDLADDRIVVKDTKGEVSTLSIDDFWSKEYRTEMPEFYSAGKATGGAGSGGAPSSAANGATGAPSWDSIAANPGVAFDSANAASA